MSHAMSIARKEWKAAFLSPVADIFLGIFLLASLFVFFFVQGFFARNIADARPFFAAMPLLLVLLASAFTMRLWSEEARSGTLEVLLTLPLKIREVVLGKFLAGVGLVAVALVLTLPVPLTISFLGDLDWGPVIGGYLGLLLLASAYLAIGMFISSLTSNQLVALLMSMVVCGLLVLLGYLPKLIPMGFAADQFLRALGTGSRFESMLRGVLDLRDLIYYLSLAAFFLVANGLVLERRRWGKNPKGQARRRNIVMGVVLLAANLLVFNIGMAPAGKMRADLTEWGEYSISPVTRQMLGGLSEPLLVRGYFSDKTHPLLDPLVPRIRDFLTELETVGGSKVTTEFVDPTSDDDALAEDQGKYAIRSLPFRFTDRHEDSVVNAYFHILIRYGDSFEVLSFADIIDVEMQGSSPVVRLRNLEYDVAKSVQKVVYGFKSIEAICNQLKGKALLRIFASSQNLPEEFAEIPDRIEKVAGDLKKRCGSKFDYQRIDPDQEGAAMSPQALYQQFGIKPMTRTLFDNRTFYLHQVVDIDQQREVLNPKSGLAEADIRKELEAVLQRHAPGFLKTIGVAVSEVKPPPRPQYPGMPQPPPPPSYKFLQKQLGDTYEVTEVDLKSGRVPGQVDVLAVLNPRDLNERELYAIDQFLMRGGSAIIAGGNWAFEPAMGGQLSVKKVNTGLDGLLAAYGVEIGKNLVLDHDNAAFPVPVIRNLGGMRVQEIQMKNYPPFVQIHGNGFDKDNPAVAALRSVVMHWPSPIHCVASKTEAPAEGKKAAEKPACRTLLASSDKAWSVENFNAQPDFKAHPELGFAAPEKTERLPLAVSLMGKFVSYFKNREAPMLAGESPPTPPGQPKAPAKESGNRAGVIEHSSQDARLVVLGSSNFLADMVLSITSQVNDTHLANMQLLTNLTDWAVQDVGLLSIRAKEQYARSLQTMKAGERLGWELGNFAFVILAVLLIGLFTLGRRGRARPILNLDAKPSAGRSD